MEQIMTSKKNGDNFVEIEVLTVSGSYPEDGYAKTPKNQEVRILLEKASKKLGIVSTEGFIATIDGAEININSTYETLNINDETTIDWSKREGGGGYA